VEFDKYTGPAIVTETGKKLIPIARKNNKISIRKENKRLM
jgi:hypothetical protein